MSEKSFYLCGGSIIALGETSCDFCQPVAVIPFEDREQVERLNSTQDAEYGRRGICVEDYDGVDADVMQAALREFANPTPPIAEPQGLGAVVEDASGDKWILVYDFHGDTKCWAKHGEVGVVSDWRNYADLTAVRVLSEGVVTP